MNINELNVGDVLVKGNHERLFRGFDGLFVAYQTKTDIKRNRVSGVPPSDFAMWMTGAKLKSEKEDTE